MQREDLVDLNAFLAVADEQSFTRAAAKLGTSQSALSYTIRRLEERLGVRLLVRTTRRVAATEAGERLLKTLRPALDEIAAELAGISEFRDKPAGNIRITTSEHAAHAILWPAIKRLLPDYPDIHVETRDRLGLVGHRRRALSTPACDSANRSPRTWSRCASDRTCAWRSLGRRLFRRKRRKPDNASGSRRPPAA